MIIWDYNTADHKIRIKGVDKTNLDKNIGGTSLPNKNVTADQAEIVVTNFLNAALVDSTMHCKIKIFSFPKKTQESNPFDYKLWLGPVGTEPLVFAGNTYWWEPK